MLRAPGRCYLGGGRAAALPACVALVPGDVPLSPSLLSSRPRSTTPHCLHYNSAITRATLLSQLVWCVKREPRTVHTWAAQCRGNLFVSLNGLLAIGAPQGSWF